MSGSIKRAVLVGLFLFGTPVSADQPPAGETLPTPRPVNPPVVIVPAPPVYRLYTPPLSRDVWQLYDVDRMGFWRPRVIISPYGDYYQYNHAAYPWAQLHPEYYRGLIIH
jgi:hypothetical protein